MLLNLNRSSFLLWIHLCPPQIYIFETLTPHMTVFGHRDFKEVMEIK